MKTYLRPELCIVELQQSHSILAGSGGVKDGDSVGDSYNRDDVTFSRNHNSFWDDEE